MKWDDRLRTEFSEGERMYLRAMFYASVIARAQTLSMRDFTRPTVPTNRSEQ